MPMPDLCAAADLRATPSPRLDSRILPRLRSIRRCDAHAGPLRHHDLANLHTVASSMRRRRPLRRRRAPQRRTSIRPGHCAESTCCKLMFQVFQMFQRYVASVLYRCCKNRPGCCTCCNGYTHMFQVYVLNVLSVSDVCCKCFIRIL